MRAWWLFGANLCARDTTDRVSNANYRILLPRLLPMSITPTIRVVVKLPWNRPDIPQNDPPPVEWNEEKADTLWKVMARSRASDSAGTDWKALAAHLQVPLPYLLYRAQTRFEEDLRGLQDIRGALSPGTSSKPSDYFSTPTESSNTASKAASRTSHASTPLGVRARLASLGSNLPRPRATTSTSTLTTADGKASSQLPHDSPLSSSDESDSESDEEAADRQQEEQEALDKKLQELQNMMTNDALGLVSSNQPRSTGRSVIRDRSGPAYESDSSRNDERSASRSATGSQSLSEASSPQGSIPSIPSPPAEATRRSFHRQLSLSKSSSPPAVSSRSARGLSHLGQHGPSDSSNQGSEASSFSDLSDASLSASALESALMSNVKPGGSRFPGFGRSASRLVGRGGL